jgi:hypothetical protein
MYLGFVVLIAITRNSTVIKLCSSEKTDVSEEDIISTFKTVEKPNQETCKKQAVN